MRDIYVIRTSENVTFEFELAGVGSRCLAWLIDILVITALLVIVGVVAGLFGMAFGGFGLVIYFVGAFLVRWGYAVLLEWWLAGQTVGKRLLGLRVMQQNGTRIAFLQSVVRNLARIVDILPVGYLVGGLSAILDQYGRRLGDVVAGTVVVRERRAPRPTAVVAPVDRYNSFIGDPNVIHATRRITPPERDAMVGLAMRRELLPLPVRHQLFTTIASHLEKRLGIERPDFFSEERYVLNLTAIVLDMSIQPRVSLAGMER